MFSKPPFKSGPRFYVYELVLWLFRSQFPVGESDASERKAIWSILGNAMRGSSVPETVRENREELEKLADSDLRSAKYAKKLIDVLDEATED